MQERPMAKGLKQAVTENLRSFSVFHSPICHSSIAVTACAHRRRAKKAAVGIFDGVQGTTTLGTTDQREWL